MWKMIVNDGETKYGPDWTWLDLRSRHGLDKLAGVGVHVPPALYNKIAELRATIPRDKVAFYNRALGTFESFGANRNGDCFARNELMRKHGTFVTNAHYFQHHQNKDPALSRGRPVASAFNDQTDMVDLIIVADMDKCADQIQALESGRRVPTSMGAKVAFDVCRICDHRARRREDYCEHVHKMAQAPYGMGQILPDGRVCAVNNPDPNFFDISDVLIGAAPESETLLKVASIVSGAEIAELVGLPKVAREIEAAITKRIPGAIEGSPIFRRRVADLHEPDIPPQVIDAVRGDSGFDGVLRNSAALGIVLKPREFSRAAKLGFFRPPTEGEIRATESMPKKVLAAALSRNSIDLLRPHYDRRSCHMPALLNRMSSSIKVAAPAGDDDVARRMYCAYRRTLLDEQSVGDEFWSMKCAETSTMMYTERSRDYVATAFLDVGEQRAFDKVLDRMNKIAEPSMVMTATITGSLADELGVDALDSLALRLTRAKGET